MAKEPQPSAVEIPENWLDLTEDEQDEWVTNVLESLGLSAND